MIRAVLDTNIFVGALIRSSGTAAKIYQATRDRKFEFITSPDIREEIGEVLFRRKVRLKHRKSDDFLSRYLEEIRQISIKVLGDLDLKVVAADPDDDKLIIAAVQGEAQYIVTRDTHLLDLERYQDIQIIIPEEFIRILGH